LTVIDLTDPDMAYLMGFLQTDGHMSQGAGNKGRLSIELAERDAHILLVFQSMFSTYTSIHNRERDTNFKEKYRSSVLTLCDLETRTLLNSLGLPYGKKSKVVSPPSVPFSEVDYYRGIIDGDGSLGLTESGHPFLSLTTSSKELTVCYLTFLFGLTGKRKTSKPTTRDRVYNPCVLKEDAQIVVSALYYEGCTCLDRKRQMAEVVLRWSRPTDMRKRNFDVKRWTPKEDTVVRGHSVPDAARILGRTEKSVRIRAFRLKHGMVGPYQDNTEVLTCR